MGVEERKKEHPPQKKKMVARAGLGSEPGSAGAGAGSYSGFLLERWV